MVDEGDCVKAAKGEEEGDKTLATKMSQGLAKTITPRILSQIRKEKRF